MSGFAPGAAFITPEQQEEVIRRTFGIVSDDIVERVPQQDEPKEEMVQITKAELEALKAGKQTTITVEEPQVAVEKEDYVSFLDQLLMITPEVEVVKEQAATEVQKDVPVKDQRSDDLRRLQEESKTYYVSIGQEAEKLGMSGKEAIDMVLAFTPTRLAEIAFIEKQISLGKTADEIFGSKESKKQMKTVATERPAIINSKYQQDTEKYERNGFI